MILLTTLAIIVAVVFGIRLFLLKRQLRRVTSQLEERTRDGSNQKITLSLIDHDLNKLAAAVNHNLKIQKSLRIEVRRNDQQLKDSIANLSHDLRTPLTSIIGYLQFAREHGCPPEEQEKYLQIVDTKAHSLQSLVNRLYELSILDVQEISSTIQKVDLNALVTEGLAGQYALFQEHSISLQVTLPNQPIWVSADSVACTRIIQNLLNNAVHYAQKQTEVILDEDKTYAILSVINPAPALSQEDIAHLFDRFYTADKSRKTGGTGLGLYIVKTLLTKINGRILNVSLNDQIFCVKIGFPLSK